MHTRKGLMLAVWVCAASQNAGAQEYRASTSIGAEGAVFRSIFQEAYRTPKEAQDKRGWDEMSYPKEDETKVRYSYIFGRVSGPGQCSGGYFAASGRYASTDRLPQHIEGGKLVRKLTIRDYGFLKEYEWRESFDVAKGAARPAGDFRFEATLPGLVVEGNGCRSESPAFRGGMSGAGMSSRFNVVRYRPVSPTTSGATTVCWSQIDGMKAVSLASDVDLQKKLLKQCPLREPERARQYVKLLKDQPELSSVVRGCRDQGSLQPLRDQAKDNERARQVLRILLDPEEPYCLGRYGREWLEDLKSEGARRDALIALVRGAPASDALPILRVARPILEEIRDDKKAGPTLLRLATDGLKRLDNRR